MAKTKEMSASKDSTSNQWHAQVWIKWNKNWPKDWAGKKRWDWLKEWPEVKWAWSAMGEWDLILDVQASSPIDLEKFVCSKVSSKDWAEKTHTHWVREVWSNAA